MGKRRKIRHLRAEVQIARKANDRLLAEARNQAEALQIAIANSIKRAGLIPVEVLMDRLVDGSPNLTILPGIGPIVGGSRRLTLELNLPLGSPVDEALTELLSTGLTRESFPR